MRWSVGVDEAGRGPVLGPLVFGICAVPENALSELVDQGVRDSKDLSPAKRRQLEDWFWEQCQREGWFGATVIFPAQRIDLALQNQGLNLLEVEGFHEALALTPNKMNCDIVVDACDVNAERFGQRITMNISDWPWPNSRIRSEHKADLNHPAVGMASILAKEERDRRIRIMEERVGVPVGSGYPSDPVTKGALPHLCRQEGIDEDVRWGWATVQKFWRAQRTGETPVRGQRRGVQQTLFQP